MTDPTIPELPFADDVLEAAGTDLEASRALLQRLLGTQDALLATSLTTSTLFTGLAVSLDNPALVVVGVPLVLALGYLDGNNWVHFRRVTSRIRSLEGLIHHYVVALRETGAARPDALRNLRRRIDGYQFGTERTFQVVRPSDVWRANKRRVRWWAHAVLAAALALCGGVIAMQDGGATGTCVVTDAGVAEVEGPVVVVDGEVTLVPCEEVPGTSSTTRP